MVGLTGIAKSTQIPVLGFNLAGLFGVSSILESRGPGVKTMNALGGFFVQEEIESASRHAPLFQVGKQLYGRNTAGDLTNFGKWTLLSSSRTSMGAKYARTMTGLPHTPQGEWDTGQRRFLGNRGLLKWFDIEQDTSKSVPHQLARRFNRGKSPSYIVNTWSNPEYGIGPAIMKTSTPRSSTSSAGPLKFNRVAKAIGTTSKRVEGIFEYVHDIMAGPKSKRSVEELSRLLRDQSILPQGMSTSPGVDELQSLIRDASSALQDPTLSASQREILGKTLGQIRGRVEDLTSKSVNEVVLSGGTRAGGGLATTTGLQIQQKFLQFYMQKAAFVSDDGGRVILDRLEAGAEDLYRSRGINETVYNEIRSQFAASRMRISQGVNTDLLGMTHEVQEMLGRRYGPG
jgi:hypothetical protein